MVVSVLTPICERQFLFAVERGDLTSVNEYIDAGGSLDVTGKTVRKTALMRIAEMHQCSEGYLKIFNQIIEFGANIRLTDLDGNSALHFAARSGNSVIAQILIEKGASRSLPNRCGESYDSIIGNSTN